MVLSIIIIKKRHPIYSKQCVIICRLHRCASHGTRITPMEKGPISHPNLTIDGEWDTQLKLSGCNVAYRYRESTHIGYCNNGYFLFAVFNGAEMAVGIDPSFRPYFQYLFERKADLSNVQFYWLGIEHMDF